MLIKLSCRNLTKVGHCLINSHPRPPQFLQVRHGYGEQMPPACRPEYISKPKVNIADLPKRPDKIPLIGYLLLPIPVTLVIGTVICERLYPLREQKLLEMARRSQAEPIDLEIGKDGIVIPDKTYSVVRVKGYFDYEKETFILNRPRKTGLEKIGYFSPNRYLYEWTTDDAKTFKQEFGHQVLTPFVLKDGKHDGIRILVNRGWIPDHFKDRPELWKDVKQQNGNQDNEIVEITGLIRKENEDPLSFWLYPQFFWSLLDPILDIISPLHPTPGSDFTTPRWKWRKIRTMSRHLGTFPIYIEMDKESSRKFSGSPIGGQSFFDEENYFWEYSWASVISGTILFWWWYCKFVRVYIPAAMKPY